MMSLKAEAVSDDNDPVGRVKGGQVRTPEFGRPLAVPESPELFDLLPIGIVELAPDGAVVRCNAAVRRLFRVPDSFAAGSGLESLGWLLSPTQVTEALTGLVADVADTDDDEATDRLIGLRHRDGTEMWIRATARRARLADADVAYLVALADVTEEHRLSEELRREREQFRVIADHAGDVVLVHRGEQIAWASPSTARLLGRDPRSLVGCTLADLGPPGTATDPLPVPPPGSSVTHRLQLRQGDGSLRWFQTTITARHPYGTAPVVYTWLRDIEDQVRAERALAESEGRLRSAFEASPDGWMILSVEPDQAGAGPKLRFEMVNARTRQLAGLSEEEILGRELGEVVEGDAFAWMYGQVARALATGDVVEGRVVMAPGGAPHVYDSFVVALDERSVLASWRDVTEIVEAQDLLSRAYEETAEMRVTLQTALDATSDGFAVYRLERGEDGRLLGLRVVHANTAGAESLGLDAETMVDMEIHEFFPEVETSGLWDHIETAATTKQPQQHRVQNFDEDGVWQAAWDNTVAPVGEERMAITWRDVSKEEAAKRQLARMRDEAMYSATHDALTDLPNRVLLRQHLHEALGSCAPEERVGIVFVDLDRFKDINDTYGHAAGDVVLRATAARLNRLVRHGDLAARLAGDEFVLVLTSLAPDWSPDQFFARASAQLSELVVAEGVILQPSASLGAVLADPRHEPVDVDDLIKRADAEMYRAKAASRRR